MSRTPRARLADGKKITITTPDSGAKPALSTGAPAIVTGRPDDEENLPVRTVRGIVKFTAMIAVVLFLLYVALASTIMVALRADGRTVLVLRGAFAEGRAPIGEFVYASSAPTDYSIYGKASAAVFGVPDGSVVQILSGPTAKVNTNSKGYLVSDGIASPYIAKVSPQTLKRQHVARCIVGACEPGSIVLVGQNAILGKAKGYLGIAGMKPIEQASRETASP